jgi:hypothetical protein
MVLLFDFRYALLCLSNPLEFIGFCFQFRRCFRLRFLENDIADQREDQGE